MRSGGLDAALATGAQVWAAIAGIANQSVLAWLLAPQGRGAFAVCFLFSSVLAVVFSMGCDRATQYQMVSGRASAPVALSSGLLIILLTSSLAVLVGYALPSTPVAYFDKATADQFSKSLLLIPLLAVAVLFQLHASGLRKFGTVLIAVTVQATLSLLLTAVFLGLFRWGVEGALYAAAASWLGSICIYAVAFLRHGDGFLSWPVFTCCFDILKYGVKYYGARLGAVFDPRLGVLLLGMTASQEMVGIYAAVSALVLRTLMVPEGIDAALASRIALDPAGRSVLVGRCVRVAAISLAAVMLVMIAGNELIVGLLFSQAFVIGADLVPILAVGVVAQAAAIILLGFFRGINRPAICSLAVWLGMAANVGLFVLFFEAGPMQAAAIGVSGGFLTRALVLLFMFSRATGRGMWRELWPRQSDFGFVFSQLLLKKGA